MSEEKLGTSGTVSGQVAYVPEHATPSTVFSTPLEYSAIETQLRFLEGKVLTVVDASFSDKEQRKAVKDLMRMQFRSQLRHIESCCFPPGYFEGNYQTPLSEAEMRGGCEAARVE